MPGARLTLEDRRQIAGWMTEGLGYAEIARRLGRPTSTISREVRATATPPVISRNPPTRPRMDAPAVGETPDRQTTARQTQEYATSWKSSPPCWSRPDFPG